MSEIIELTPADFAAQVALGAKAIRDGYVIVAPLEHGYAYLCDAFSHDAVRTRCVARLGLCENTNIGRPGRAAYDHGKSINLA